MPSCKFHSKDGKKVATLVLLRKLDIFSTIQKHLVKYSAVEKKNIKYFNDNIF